MAPEGARCGGWETCVGCPGEAGSRSGCSCAHGSGVVLYSLPGALNVLFSDSTLVKHPSSVPVQ